jgi:hypothetical protein
VLLRAQSAINTPACRRSSGARVRTLPADAASGPPLLSGDTCAASAAATGVLIRDGSGGVGRAPARRGSSAPGLIPSSSRSSAPARELARAVRQLVRVGVS